MKIKIHETLIILVIISFFTGIFTQVMVVYLCVLFHEIGHIIACRYFKRKINRFIMLPIGGIIEYQQDENVSLISDFIISSAGIMVNIILFIILKIFAEDSMFYSFNKLVLLFNILPIYPLDGSRMLEVLLMKVFKFKKALDILIYISFVTNIFVIVYILFKAFSVGILLILFYLLVKNIKLYFVKEERYQNFLTKKYLYPNYKLKDNFFSDTKNGIIKHFKKGVNNNFGDEKKHIIESDILKRYFEK